MPNVPTIAGCIAASGVALMLLGCSAATSTDARVAFDRLTLSAAVGNVEGVASRTVKGQIVVDGTTIDARDCWAEFARMRPSDGTPKVNGDHAIVPFIWLHMDGSVYRGDVQMVKSMSGEWLLERMNRKDTAVIVESRWHETEPGRGD